MTNQQTPQLADQRIRSAFAHGKAFIPFVTCGDPDIATTEKLVLAMADAGADLVELGIPFSDPTAEGPVIQDADLRALSAGTTTDDCLQLAARLRQHIDTPMVFMTYANVIYSYGAERFCMAASQAGVQGIIVPDCPFEERDEFASACKQAGLVQIFMIAPTSQSRITQIAREAKGFLYCVSSLGVTGTRSQITTNIAGMVEAVRQASDVPCAVGFGISSPEQAKRMAEQSDGAIVGSAIVKLCAQYGADATEPVAAFVKEMKDALRELQ